MKKYLSINTFHCIHWGFLRKVYVYYLPELGGQLISHTTVVLVHVVAKHHPHCQISLIEAEQDARFPGVGLLKASHEPIEVVSDAGAGEHVPDCDDCAHHLFVPVNHLPFRQFLVELDAPGEFLCEQQTIVII